MKIKKYVIRPMSRILYSFMLVVVVSQWGWADSFSQPSATLKAGAVATPDSYGTLVAKKILQEGGNAVDAAVATAFTLAVTYPEAGNIGGGGFMTLFIGGKAYFLDYREVAPQKASADMYLDAKGEVIPNASLYSYNAVAVPGTVAGMWAVHQRFGRLPWQQVLAPAINYARYGFIVNPQLMQRYQETYQKAQKDDGFVELFGSMQQGKLFKQPELAAVLERIAQKGETEFYQGETAHLLADMMKERGILQLQDLNQYRVKWRDPIQAQWQGMQVITAPPPSSGGIGLLQLLLMKQYLKKAFQAVPVNSPQYVHLLAEIEKRVFADRARYLGDPDFVNVPVNALLDEHYLAKRAAEVNPAAISDTGAIEAGLNVEEREKLQTTHFSIMDKWGNAVSNTYTLNGWFGAAIVAKGTGILLNNEMDDFSSKMGVANQFGVIGNKANAIAPFKRPLSSMSPTIIVKNNKPLLVIGTPGGSRIFTSIFQVIVNVFDYQMTLKEAVGAPRYHHQLWPKDTLFIERFQNAVPGQLKDRLQRMGYHFFQQAFSGDIQAIQLKDDTPHAVADPRGRGVGLTVY